MPNNKHTRVLKLEDLDLTKRIRLKDYKAKLVDLQIDLVQFQRRVVEKRERAVLVFEGMDAAGKGGAIKRLTQFLDPRGVDVHAIGAPNPQEKSHHWLRRFWLRLPSGGRFAIFDRSWYGRMLVEPIEGFCTEEEYRRAPQEIREFERVLADDGYLLMKFWVHVDEAEQLHRFESRQDDPLRQWKITKEDWRNRGKFEDYVRYADEMFTATDATFAPWHLIAGNSKRYARIAVLKAVVQNLKRLD